MVGGKIIELPPFFKFAIAMWRQNIIFVKNNFVSLDNMSARDVRYLIVTAGGSGMRMGGSVPKQFAPINGIPVLRRTLDRFFSLPIDFRLILVLPSDQKRRWLEYCRDNEYDLGKYMLVSGGVTRFHSVKNALRYVEDGALAIVHDGVRPFVDKDLIMRLIDLASVYPAVCPAVPSVDTLRLMSGCDGFMYADADADRSKIFGVQTPQVFHSELLKKAYGQPFSENFTDDASVVEGIGCKVRYIRGNRFNLKLTTPDDMVLAQALVDMGL